MSYNEKVIDHYENPRNVGALDKNATNVGTGMVGAPSCGDVMKLQIQVENGIIKDAKFKTFGCGSAIASSSLVTEMIKGMDLDQALSIKNKDIATELGLPPVKHHCSVLAEDAIKAAIKNYKEKNNTDQTICSSIMYENQDNFGIQITEAALKKIKSIFENSPEKTAIKFMAKDGGCSGKKYDISLEDKNDTDHIILGWKIKLIHNGAENQKQIMIDKDSLDLFKNTVIDYEKKELEERFIFQNPNTTSTCGCGKSFN
jgi:nitrogen fixation NifU-like protein